MAILFAFLSILKSFLCGSLDRILGFFAQSFVAVSSLFWARTWAWY